MNGKINDFLSAKSPDGRGRHASEETNQKISESLRKRMHNKGETNIKAVLTVNKVKQIRSGIYDNWKIKDIAEKFNISPSCAYKVLKYKTWKDV